MRNSKSKSTESKNERFQNFQNAKMLITFCEGKLNFSKYFEHNPPSGKKLLFHNYCETIKVNAHTIKEH